MLHPRFVDAVRFLYPGVSFLKDVILQDDWDGKGPWIKKWTLSNPPPTDAEIDAMIPNPLDKKQTPQEKVQAILGPSVTIDDLKAALK